MTCSQEKDQSIERHPLTTKILEFADNAFFKKEKYVMKLLEKL